MWAVSTLILECPSHLLAPAPLLQRLLNDHNLRLVLVAGDAPELSRACGIRDHRHDYNTRGTRSSLLFAAPASGLQRQLGLQGSSGPSLAIPLTADR